MPERIFTGVFWDRRDFWGRWDFYFTVGGAAGAGGAARTAELGVTVARKSWPRKRKPPGASRKVTPGPSLNRVTATSPGARCRAPRISVRSARPEVQPAAGTGWTRPVSPGVRCLPCI